MKNVTVAAKTLMKKSTTIGNFDASSRPGLVAVVAGDQKQCLTLARQARADGADILELRADLCRTNGTEITADALMAIIADIREHVTLPILLTIRRLSEGGYFFGEEVERLAYFKSLLPAVDAVDIELYDTQDIREQIIEHAHKQSKTVVLSYHNFRRTPSERRFSEIVEDAVTVGGDIVKIAVMAEKVEDVELLMKFTTDFNAREILLATMSMGDLGRVTRAVNPFLGSCLTYGYVGEVPTTPGQLPVRELRAVLDLFPGQRIPVASLDVVYGLLKKVAHKATSSPVRESAGAV